MAELANGGRVSSVWKLWELVTALEAYGRASRNCHSQDYQKFPAVRGWISFTGNYWKFQELGMGNFSWKFLPFLELEILGSPREKFPELDLVETGNSGSTRFYQIQFFHNSPLLERSPISGDSGVNWKNFPKLVIAITRDFLPDPVLEVFGRSGDGNFWWKWYMEKFPISLFWD